ncbi:MAG TPA: hypothetical protein VN947_36240 [Polyangia bacterium]|nr:hypothetical protein [Polyangia bacterium]
MRAAVLTASLLLCASAASARTKTYAVVIAENRSLDPGVKPLQFADDDGAKTWELFSLFADRTALFVVLDADTARLYPEAAAHAESPERAAIFDKLARFNAEMARDIDRGDEPELFFIYAGHGDVDGNGQGYINLRDSRLTRAELYRDIIAPSKAKFVHVVVDACKSYFLVNARGAHKRWVDDSVPPDEGAAGDAHLQAFLEEEQLERHPRAGVIVATSGDQETHEWARYRGGILSHELRSALSGAADVNNDGKIEYSELRAFLAAANARVRNPEARVDVFARAPALDRHHPIVDLARVSPAAARFLRFGAGLGGRFFVEDDRGVRVLDLNKEPGASFDVMVSKRHAYYVRSDDQEAEARPGDRRLDVATLSWHARTIAARGALDTTFRNDLYREPFGRAFYDGFVATSGDLPVEDNAVGTLVVTPAPRARPRHRISIAYGLSGAPAGDTGLSNGVDLRYAYRFWRALDLGIAGQTGYGASPAGSLWRAAAMVVLGAEWRPIARLGLRLDTAVGWQLLSGTLKIAGVQLTGTEPRGFRYELAGGLNVNVAGSFGLFARGGLALDGVYPKGSPSSLTPNGFLNIGVQFSL